MQTAKSDRGVAAIQASVARHCGWNRRKGGNVDGAYMRTMAEVRAFLYDRNFDMAYEKNRLAVLLSRFPEHRGGLTHLPENTEEVQWWWVPDHSNHDNGLWFALKPVMKSGNRHKSAKHRFLFGCPECKRWVSVGRVHQHHHRKGAKP